MRLTLSIENIENSLEFSILYLTLGSFARIWLFLVHWKNTGLEPESIEQKILKSVPSDWDSDLGNTFNFGGSVRHTPI